MNRVHDAFFDQLSATGHDKRIADLDLFAQLGLRRLRYPVLWERTALGAPDSYDWRWADERLHRLRELGIDPIVGLVHHGSGPRYTNLLDERFPELLASYAHAVASRFPWVERYTPINEPLTTARFSALYGHWFPHRSDDRSFALAIVNQCRAIVLAMRAIRQVNPAAQLIQTDDLGLTTSTGKLAYQAKFDNERRWLSWDLLCGLVGPKHSMWEYLTAHGITPARLGWFADNACPPDVIGINHYVTSDRYLDEELRLFPPATWGSNGRHSYADIETVRSSVREPSGVAGAIADAWMRYRKPLAITEAHLGCTREEQLRWLHSVWRSAQEAQARGVDIRAVTVWALLGNCDWDSLLTRVRGHYEPGVFDIRSKPPRPTALSVLVRELISNSDMSTPILEEPGWWHRRPPHPVFEKRSPVGAGATPSRARRPLIIAGGSGTLGQAFARICEVRGLGYITRTRTELDICDGASIARALDDVRPRAVVNAAGYGGVDEAELQRSQCYRENSYGAAALAEACASRSIPFLTYSSDLVFDGHRSTAYVESSDVGPLNVYGSSKAAAERAVARTNPRALIIRSSSFFGPWDRGNFVTLALRALACGGSFDAIDDVIVSPTYLPDLVNASLDLLLDGESGLWHLANSDSLSWVDFAKRAAVIARISTDRLAPRSACSLDLLARRPRFSALTSERGSIMPSLDDALARYVAAAMPLVRE